ncbi:dynein intermediate chain 4, axonemal isoform X3 [Cygnus olor]|uniref:dynein intermediate chain 4, axonemal isoform X3 n=1 Tax=Cygnus olor TaxID=8869 RepID=UPI001ADEB3B9|nr:dynein intermediate chain 4, axonemal isoform X3 [Cygnus olor]
MWLVVFCFVVWCAIASNPGCSVRQGSGTSLGSQRKGSLASGAYTSRAARRRSQFTISYGKAADKGSPVDKKYAVRVFDDEGKDVTPHPLFHSDPDTAVPRQAKLLASSDYSGGVLSSFPMHQTGGDGSFVDPFSRRTCGNSSISKPNASTMEFMLDEIVEPGSQGDTAVSLSDVQVRREEVEEQLTEEDLDRRVDIYLTETETIWMLDIPSVVASVESEDAGRILERNKIYVDICKNRPGNDRFVEKMMQTINGAAKNKEVQCDKIVMEDKGMVVTSWDLYDSFNVSETEPTSKGEATNGKSSTSHMTKKHDQTASVTSARGNITSVTTLESATLARIHEEEKNRLEAILTSENFQQDLFFMERVLMENIFQPKLAAYRQFPVLIDPAVTSDNVSMVVAVKEAKQEEHDKGKKSKEEQKEALIDPSIPSDLNKALEETVPPSLEQLWSYTCDLTKGHNVSSMAWSKVNPDLLAVGYGAFDFKEQKKGLACCWSLKNPMWPERIFQCEHGVTALDFSMTSPNLLAVGMYNGTITIYNVRSCTTTAILNSRDSSERHTGPVWQLKWLEQDRDTADDDKRERLISISADGRLTKWLIQKGLDCTDLMKIKRAGSEKKNLPCEKERKSVVLISQQAAGMCFDFHPKDTNFYLAGTEEGLIHKCSCSYDQQFLETYKGHKGPVYKVAWNPFSTDMFLSCSADWTIMLWHQNSQMPILTFSSTTTVVHDIMWSPKSVFIFAAANESRAEIWDLSVSILDPVITRFANPEAKFTSVLFAKNADCLLVGDSRGEVSVFELQNLAASSSTKVDALRDVISPALTT